MTEQTDSEALAHMYERDSGLDPQAANAAAMRHIWEGGRVDGLPRAAVVQEGHEVERVEDERGVRLSLRQGAYRRVETDAFDVPAPEPIPDGTYHATAPGPGQRLEVSADGTTRLVPTNAPGDEEAD